jgi:hypothetical protein
MAWRIDEAVIRGEIDNRTRDRVTGRLWLAGRTEPVELELTGNAWRDLAGRRLEFTNATPKPGDLKGLASKQIGVIGDCTASRKVKVPDIPMDQIGEYYAAKKKWTWHWGNSLYLEWFSATNGRVVIESASYELVVSPDIAWDMTPDEEEAQRRFNGEALEKFMGRLSEATSAAEPVADVAWETDAPLSEAEAEKLQTDSDELIDRINARMKQEGPAADFQKILEEELERRRLERGEKSVSPEEEAERDEWLDELNQAAELGENDPELIEEAARKHPLAEQALALSIRLLSQLDQHRSVKGLEGSENPGTDLISSVSIAGAKLAGALNSCEWPPPRDQCASRIVWLKRARDHLANAMVAAEACAKTNSVDPLWLKTVRDEVSKLADETDGLIAELRDRLERGFD